MTESRYKLHLGDCLEVMRGIEAGSVDAIVSDPPYGLSFMGKDWDKGVPGEAFWVEALRVARPGAHLLAFGGTRTFHRLACAIEDAGWELRDTVMWVYGCLSEDSEYLTRDGWEHFHKSINGDIIIDKEILVYDIQNDVYKWERPERWSYYHVKQDTAYRIQSDNTDQLVSRNHRCLVERGGELAFVAAEELAGMEAVPTLPDNFFVLSQAKPKVLQSRMQRILQGARVEGTRPQRAGGVEPRNKRQLSSIANGGKQSILEGRGDLLQAQGEVCRPVYKIRAMSTRTYQHGTKGRVRYGASLKSCSGDWQATNQNGMRTPHKPRRNGQQAGKSNAFCNQRRPQAVRTRASYRTSLATVTPVEYTGLIWCPTVSTGSFVARRNGKVFITGNSGFPKSHSVSKAIDREAGAEREVVGQQRRDAGSKSAHQFESSRDLIYDITTPATAEAEQWDGWGTALKPAWEPIIVARKPIEGTVAANVLAYGTGGLNIDGCRVGVDPAVDDPRLGGNGAWTTTKKQDGDTVSLPRGTVASSPLGRWPANLIHDGSEEVLGLFPDSNSGNQTYKVAHQPPGQNGIYGKYNGTDTTPAYTDSGTAARFFYCAKASKEDRDEGCGALEEVLTMRYNEKAQGPHPKQTPSKPVPQRNPHPTVKPTDLMRYLCRLVTPPDGVILDPFMGSGSTGKGAVLEGFRFVGIDITAEYVEIARARLEFAEVQYRNAAGEIVVTAKERERGMVSLFDWAGQD